MQPSLHLIGTSMNIPAPHFSVDLTGQTALVTGASSGLGLRFAKVLAAAGARVAVAARRMERLEELVKQIQEAGAEALPIQLDVGNAEQIATAVSKAEQALGPVTILVNNAGITRLAPATQMPLAMIDEVIATNLRAPYLLSCELARRLMAAKLPGRIVNIASMAAFHCDESGVGIYSTTKAAVVRMTEALAVEWAKFNINVNAIAPGAFHSEMMDAVLHHVPHFAERFPRGRIGIVEQLDSTLLYLVSPSSDFVTGTCIKVDDAQLPR
jgi:NAD(P)-dependent dehydrogenase (short-subunit alcohol dehydrogenase family)